MSLHRAKGGKACQRVEPSEREGVALSLWALVSAGRIQATFPTGPKNKLQWHDGYVVACCEQRPEEGARYFKYRLFFPIGADDVWIWPPFDDKSVCFRKAHLPEIPTRGPAQLSCTARSGCADGACRQR